MTDESAWKTIYQAQGRVIGDLYLDCPKDTCDGGGTVYFDTNKPFEYYCDRCKTSYKILGDFKFTVTQNTNAEQSGETE